MSPEAVPIWKSPPESGLENEQEHVILTPQEFTLELASVGRPVKRGLLPAAKSPWMQAQCPKWCDLTALLLTC